MALSKVKSRSDHDVAHLHILTHVPSVNFLHITVSEIQPGQTFFPPPIRIPWVKTIPRQPGCGVKMARVSTITPDYYNSKDKSHN